MKHVILAVTLCLFAACVDSPDEVLDEPVVEEVTRAIAIDDPAEVEIGMSEVQQSAAVSQECAACVAACCGPSCYNNPDQRYACAQQCWIWARCTMSEMYSFRPRYQTP